MFNGKKTYLVGLGTILSAAGGVLTGTVDVATAVQLAVTALIGMTLKHGQQTGK